MYLDLQSTSKLHQSRVSKEFAVTPHILSGESDGGPENGPLMPHVSSVSPFQGHHHSLKKDTWCNRKPSLTSTVSSPWKPSQTTFINVIYKLSSTFLSHEHTYYPRWLSKILLLSSHEKHASMPVIRTSPEKEFDVSHFMWDKSHEFSPSNLLTWAMTFCKFSVLFFSMFSWRQSSMSLSPPSPRPISSWFPPPPLHPPRPP